MCPAIKAAELSGDSYRRKQVAAIARTAIQRKHIVKSREKNLPAVIEPAKKMAVKKSVSATPVTATAPAAAKTAEKAAVNSSLSQGKIVKKPSASSTLKVAVKSEVKPVGKSTAVNAPVVAPAKMLKGAPKESMKISASAPVVAAPAPRPAPAPPPMSTLKPPPPLKPGRRSSARTAAQSPPPAPMVPTHAPDAAKASYSTMIERVIAPLPQAAAKKDPKLANNWKTKAAAELTDDEIKSMPDGEYMNETQLAFFRYKLSVLKQDIHNSAGATTEHLREDTVVVPDPADRATIEEEHALELRTRDRERKLLKKIEQSIGRIDSGDYGYCDETGEAIGVGRLIARPTANLSLEAQQRRELKQKMFGD